MFKLFWCWLTELFVPTPDEARERGFAYALAELDDNVSAEALRREINLDATDENERQFNFGVLEGIVYRQGAK